MSRAKNVADDLPIMEGDDQAALMWAVVRLIADHGKDAIHFMLKHKDGERFQVEEAIEQLADLSDKLRP